MTVYEVITARIVEMLEQGTIPWRRPWKAGASEPRNLVSDKPYRYKIGMAPLKRGEVGFRRHRWEPLSLRKTTFISLSRVPFSVDSSGSIAVFTDAVCPP